MNQQTNKLVLVKRLKGWLALMMAVTMLFGSSMTVLAEDVPREPMTTYITCDYDSDTGIRFIVGIGRGDTLSAGDSITYNGAVGSGGFNSVTLIIDGAPVDNAWGGGRTYTFDKDVIVTDVELLEAESYRYATISFISSGSGSNNNSGNDTSKDEGEEFKEEPKENEEHIFTRELLEQAAGAKSGDSMVIDATLWHSFNANVLKELLSKEGVSYTFYYNYGGECFYITIPAGAVLEEGCEWYGPLKLNAMFGRTMIDKKDLHAAINK